MNILVTGGAGYIGSHTVRLLEKKADRVVVYDNLVKGHRQAVGKSVFVQGDLLDSGKLIDTIQRYAISSVVHFAAASLVGESMGKPRDYYRNNVQGTLNLLDVMLDNKVGKLVFSSTAAVYGEPEITPITEDAAKNPTNVYGRTKLAMENAMDDYSRAYGLKYIALRYFNACGADPAGDIGEDHEPETHLVPLVLRACLGKSDGIKIFGDDYPTQDGTCIRDYIHVTDLAQAHGLALEALYGGHGSDVYNLGNGSGFSVKEIIEAAETVTGIKIRQEVIARRAGDPAVLVAGAAKIKRDMNWQPQYTDIKEIIATAWRWHRANPDGFPRLGDR
ncbi:UDP-glucose 4-epimerase GalE [Acetonema longum]|uniref:UDP-glucose 4-epimerase n=1 Tax=Acetonema longum DSM 6540 TaxID=1009370 RepID=F7NG01_9FIRM|nr:UDP-glucose 4-epimerase GalE [Acetonema longum]EGO65030.1 UDP-glucose 4-epimerase [Acetonema longum DSM 6540]